MQQICPAVTVVTSQVVDLGLLPADRMFCTVFPFSPNLYGLILESADEWRGAVA